MRQIGIWNLWGDESWSMQYIVGGMQSMKLSNFFDTSAWITLQAPHKPLNLVQCRLHPRQLFLEKR